MMEKYLIHSLAVCLIFFSLNLPISLIAQTKFINVRINKVSIFFEKPCVCRHNVLKVVSLKPENILGISIVIFLYTLAKGKKIMVNIYINVSNRKETGNH